MSLFDYDYEDLARQVQHGLERIGVNFLRAHGARIRRDLMDFHGNEQIDLELTHGGHALAVRQAGHPRGAGVEPAGREAPPLEIFESNFDGWPSTNTPPETIMQWLASLPPGVAPPEPKQQAAEAPNPFAAQRRAPTLRPALDQEKNPFSAERASDGGQNPFARRDRDHEREELLRRLKGDGD